MESSAVLVCESTDDKDSMLRETKLVNQHADLEAGRCLKPGFRLRTIQRDKDCMFRALALCWGVKANTPYEVRDRIVYRLCDYVSEDGNTETFVSFMEKVHRKYLKWEKYWGEDCKSLLTTIGLNMNMVSVVTCEGLETCRAVLCGYPLSRILDFLCGETTASYRERISYPKYRRGDYPELVAAGQIWKRHIVVLQPVPSQNVMTETRIDYAGLEVCESKTTYLVRVNDNHYHACEFQKERQVDTLARLLVPAGFYVEEMQGDKLNFFCALAHAWQRDSEAHQFVRMCLVDYICLDWNRPWWVTQCRQAFPEYMNEDRFLSSSQVYSQYMRAPIYQGGDIPELVAAGRMIGCHVVVMVHKAVEDAFLSTIQIKFGDTEVRRDNTLYILRVADGRFHVLEPAPGVEPMNVPSTISRRLVAGLRNTNQTITISKEQEQASSVAGSPFEETRSMKKAKLN